MARLVTHKKIVQFHREIQTGHNDLEGFFRFNWNEIKNTLRSGIPTPCLALESHSSELAGNKVSNFNHRAISFLLLDYTGSADEYDRQEDVLDHLEGIGLDICSYLMHCNQDKNHWLYGLFDVNTFKMEKVGPVFDNMYGWNILYTIKNQEKMCFDPDKWTFPQTAP